MPRIYILTGPDTGLEREVGDGAVIGRSDDCAVKLRDASVSRHHARLERREGGYEVVDLGSVNGITKDGARAPRIAVAHGMEFFVGSVRVRFVDAPAGAVEEIEVAAAPEDGAAPGPAGATRAKTAQPQGSVLVGAARRRAIAQSRGVLQFDRIEGRDASLLRDDMTQQSAAAKWGMVAVAILIAAALCYGAFRLAAGMTPEGGGAAAPPEAPAGPR